ncbi:TrmH family RNA methyltransferase [Flexivirga meconopsidis]|uniref:TrmH family RNA methyltransferase n=1 Tax=Flexivirga meconopsidis TaxID=2977121 RepID=UPI00223F2377
MTGPALITDRSDPAVQRLTDLNRKARGPVRSLLIEDFDPLLQAIRSGLDFVEVYGLQGADFPDEIREACDDRRIPVRLLSTELAGEIFKIEKKPKVFGIAHLPKPARLRDVADNRQDLVVLDGVKIVGNIGAIIRSSFAFGVSAVVLIDSDLPSIADRRLVRASRGYVFSLPVILATRQQLASFLQDQASGVRLATFDAHAETQLEELAGIPDRLALVLGSERFGPSSELHRGSALEVSIPMNPDAESLNVSVSAGIAMYTRAAYNLSR